MVSLHHEKSSSTNSSVCFVYILSLFLLIYTHLMNYDMICIYPLGYKKYLAENQTPVSIPAFFARCMACTLLQCFIVYFMAPVLFSPQESSWLLCNEIYTIFCFTQTCRKSLDTEYVKKIPTHILPHSGKYSEIHVIWIFVRYSCSHRASPILPQIHANILFFFLWLHRPRNKRSMLMNDGGKTYRVKR